MQNETILINDFSSKSVIFKTSLNTDKLYIILKNIFPWVRILPPKSPPISLDKASKLQIARKTINFSVTFHGWSRYGCSWEIEWKWNHDDPTIESSGISPESRGPPNGFFAPLSTTIQHLTSRCQCPLVSASQSYWDVAFTSSTPGSG